MLLPLECEPNWYVVIHSVPLHFTLPALYSSQSCSLQVLQQITLGVSDGSFHTLEYLNYLQSSYLERHLPVNQWSTFTRVRVNAKQPRTPFTPLRGTVQTQVALSDA